MLEWKKENRFVWTPVGHIKRTSITATTKYNNATCAAYRSDNGLFYIYEIESVGEFKNRNKFYTAVVEGFYIKALNDNLCIAEKHNQIKIFDTFEEAKSYCGRFYKIMLLK